MPNIPWPARGDVPPVGDPAYDALLDGTLPPEDAGGVRPVAEVLAALNSAPAASELAAEASALAVFRGGIGRPAAPARPHRRRRPVLTSLLSAKFGATAAAAAVTLSGAAVAAYAGVLPASMQRLAHDTIGAPSAPPGAHPAHPAIPVGPKAPGSAAYGLCTAYAHLKAHGSAEQKAVAFRNLAAAAGGAANVTAYCAGVPHPAATPSGKQPTHPAGKPATHPSHGPATHPAGKPATHPSHGPATHPAGKPATHSTGKPASTS